ncbi:hypothetical protein M1563_03750 [Patescibacteria group bacterium]|nr:hypothetical protein [Patescibacteria group bacterium]MCL5410047.1 hypothetical protein [Patescibacteria group bacterium]
MRIDAEGAMSLLAAGLVLFTALLNPTTAAIIAVALLFIFSIYKIFWSSRN